MTPKEISDILKSKFGNAIVEVKIDGAVDPYVKVASAGWKEVSLFLRDDPELNFDFLMCLSGVDYGKGTLGVVYNIYSMTKQHKVNIKIEVPKDNAEVPTVSDVWQTANWHEREAYDLVGIKFIGHPDPRRIMMPDDWEGHPLQKDYKVPEFYKGMKIPY